MDSAKLETFLFVCKEKSFTKAAEKLFITPAAVKKQIDSLEDEVGVQLIFRSPLGCSLTTPGEIFHEQAKKILKLINTSIEKTQEAEKTQTQELRIGHSVKFDYNFISDILDSYSEAYPDSMMRFERIRKSEISTALQKQVIDCFLYINPHRNDFPGVESELVGTTRIHAIMRRKHPFAQKDIVSIADLQGFDIYLSAVLDQSLFDALDANIGTNLHILDKEDRNDLMNSLQRGAVFLYPCPVSHDVSVPFDYPPMDIRLFYTKKTPVLEHFIQHLQAYFASDHELVIM